MGAVYPQCCGTDVPEEEMTTELKSSNNNKHNGGSLQQQEVQKLQQRIQDMLSERERLTLESGDKLSKLAKECDQKSRLLERYDELLKADGLSKARYETEITEYRSKISALQDQVAQLSDEMEQETAKMEELERERAALKSDNLKLIALVDQMKEGDKTHAQNDEGSGSLMTSSIHVRGDSSHRRIADLMQGAGANGDVNKMIRSRYATVAMEEDRISPSSKAGKSKSPSLEVTPVPSLSAESQESIDSLDEAEQMEINRRKKEQLKQMRHQREMKDIQATHQAMQRSMGIDELGDDRPGGMFRESSDSRWNPRQIQQQKDEMLQALALAVQYSNNVSRPPSTSHSAMKSPNAPVPPIKIPKAKVNEHSHTGKTSKLVDEILTDMDIEEEMQGISFDSMDLSFDEQWNGNPELEAKANI